MTPPKSQPLPSPPKPQTLMLPRPPPTPPPTYLFPAHLVERAAHEWASQQFVSRPPVSTHDDDDVKKKYTAVKSGPLRSWLSGWWSAQDDAAWWQRDVEQHHDAEQWHGHAQSHDAEQWHDVKQWHDHTQSHDVEQWHGHTQSHDVEKEQHDDVKKEEQHDDAEQRDDAEQHGDDVKKEQLLQPVSN